MPTERDCPVCNGDRFSPVARPVRAEVKLTPVVCQGCGLVFVNPMYHDHEKEALRPSKRALHRPVRHRRSLDSAFQRQMARAGRCMDLLKPYLKPGDEVLDVGSGDGAFLHLLKEFGAQARGVDLDPEGCRYIEQSVGVPMVCAPFEEADFGGRQFDAVVSSHVIEHVVEPVEVLKQIYTLLKPGGLVFLETPNIWHPKVGPRRLFCLPHNYYFSPRTLSLALFEAGFRTEAIREFRHDSFQVVAYAATAGNLVAAPLGDRADDVMDAVRRHRRQYYLSMQYAWRKLPLGKAVMYRTRQQLAGDAVQNYLTRAA